MGKVFLAHDTVLDRPVALKFLGTRDLDGVARERFLIEARALARLQHPNVVAVYRVGELGRRPYIVSEFVHGQSLDKVAKPLPWPQVRDLAIGLARGLAAAHRRGVLHRDIKPGNAILTDDDAVKLLDFGLAKFTDRSLVGGASNPNALPPQDVAAPPPPGELTVPLVDAMIPPTPLGGRSTQLTAVPVDRVAPVITPNPFELTHDTSQLEDEPPDVHGETMESGELAMSPSEAMSTPSLTRAGAVMGTPYYMAPEIWRAEPATERSDIYSLGVLLFELLVGKPPHRANVITELAMIVQEADAIPLKQVVSGIDLRFAAIVDRCLRRDALDRFGSADELRGELETLQTPIARIAIPDGNPYPGLQAFEAGQGAVFFGRDAEIRAVIDRLRTDPFVLVAGESGVGKSSLCHAGVGPAIADGALGDGRAWKTITIGSGRRPSIALAAALANAVGVDAVELEAALGSGDAVALSEHRRAIHRALGSERGAMLILDHVEELVTIADRTEATAVAVFLAELLASGCQGFRLLGAIRGDYLTRAANLESLGDQMPRALYVLRPMTEEGIRKAIVDPARAKQVRFEPASVIDELVAAAASAGLPLVQFALAELWNARADGMISAAALERLGGVAGALTRHADAVIASMPDHERTEAARMLLALIGANGARTRRSRDELVLDRPSAERALESLIKGRLVAPREGEDELSFEIAHDALIQSWDRLRRWVDDDGELRIIRRRVEAAAADWARHSQVPELLWRDRRVRETDRIAPDQLTAVPRDFLLASRAAVRRKHVTRIALAVGIPILVVVAIVFVRMRVAAAEAERIAVDQRQRDARVATHASEADRLIAKAYDVTKLRADREAAFVKFDARDLVRAEPDWITVLKRAGELDAAYSLASQELEHALVIDPVRDDVRQRLAEILHHRAQLADDFHDSKHHAELLRRLALYDTSGKLVASWHAPARLSIDITPKGATIAIAKLEREGPRRIERPAEPLGASPLTHSVPPGDFVLVVSAPGHAPVRAPIRVRAGEQLAVAIALPKTLPDGFVFVPAGRFLVGTADEGARTSFLSTVPLHAMWTGAYLIAKHETTFAEWIEFLDAIPEIDRERHRPNLDSPWSGDISLHKTKGRWTFRLRPKTKSYVAGQGEPIQYLDRATRAVQTWERFPVIGISLEDVRVYVQWLRDSGRVRGARPCTEVEWERAARGADDREFPHGDVLGVADANFDETYGKRPQAFGLDEVGSYPASRSPFGLDDMAGNAFEWTVPTLTTDQAAIRGGTFYFGALTARLTNRNTVEPTARSIQLGVRVCADAVE